MMETKMDLLKSPCLFAIAKKNLLNECCMVLENDCSLENTHIQVSTCMLNDGVFKILSYSSESQLTKLPGYLEPWQGQVLLMEGNPH